MEETPPIQVHVRNMDEEEAVSRSKLDATLDKLSIVLDAISRQMPPVQPEMAAKPVGDDELPWAATAAERYPVKDPAKYTDFERKYPPDRFGEEAVDAARVWKVYRDRANEQDQDKIDGWNKTLDILLIFAGLFSAVATAFLIDSYKQLQPDYVEILALVVIAMQTNSTIPRPADFVPTSLARCTNWLWFVSLSLALVVALFAILAKQWLETYSSQMRSPAASNRKWAWRHVFFSAGLSKWRLDVFISTLPVLLHLSLGFFFVGLVLFMWPVDATIAYTLSAGSAVIIALYIVLGVLPIWYANCPTATPLLHQLQRAYAEGLDVLYRALIRLVPEGLPVAIETSNPALSSPLVGQGNDIPLVQPPSPAPGRSKRGWSRPLSAARDVVLRVVARSRVRASENRFVAGTEPECDSKALHWMITTLPSDDDVAVALDAIGSLPLLDTRMQTTDYDEYRLLHDSDVVNHCSARLLSLLSAGSTDELDAMGRGLRTALFLCDDLPAIVDPDQKHGYFRWFSVKQYDISLIAPAVWGIQWITSVRLYRCPPMTQMSASPCLPSTLALLAERQSHPSIEQSAVVYVCGISGLLDLPLMQRHVTHRALEKVLDSAEAAILEKEGVLRATGDANSHRTWWSPIPLVDLRLRGLRLWGHVLQHHNSLGFLEQRLFQSAFCLTAEDMVKDARWYAPDRPPPFSQWLSYVGSEEFASLDWPASTIDALRGCTETFGVFYASNSWDAHAGAIVRGIAEQCRRHSTAHLSRRGVQMIFEARLEFECATNDELGKIYASPEAVQHESPLNVLQPGNGVVNRSAWAYALDLMPNVPTGDGLFLVLSAVTHSSTLLTLHRCGFDVSEMLDELVGHGRGVALILWHPKCAVPIARHLMEISPEWWFNTTQELLALPPAKWPSPTDDPDDPENYTGYPGYLDAATFVAAVVREGNCTNCPQNVAFVGAIGRIEEAPRDSG